jgi:adrenodoxin-NADP+ reductase
LVRFGVAPDHPDVKSVSHDFEVVMNDARFAFYGRVHVGRDVGLQELRQHYSAVVLAYGAAGERMLDLPGSELEGIHPARHFVNWYNAHPEHSGDTHDFKLEQVRSVAIIGQGNVAVDCARVLLSPVGRLEHTDISLDALQHLSASQVQRVHMIGRRGAVQSAFSIGELRELATGVDRGIAVSFDPKELQDSENEASLAEIQASRPKKRKHDLLRSIAAGTLPGMATTITAGSAASASDPAASASSAEATAAAGHPSSSSSVKDLHIRYLLRPKAFLPSASDPRRVGGLLLERTALSGPPEAQEARSTGEEVRIEAELILTSIGYKSVPIDESLPFDHRKHVVPSVNGRVLRSAHTGGGGGATESAEVEPGLYVSGWLRRGPSGIIATNIMDARDTVKSLMADLRAGALLQHPAPVPTPLSILSPEQIKARRIVTREGWARIQAAELAEGLAKGKAQVKFDNEEQLLRAAETDVMPSL